MTLRTLSYRTTCVSMHSFTTRQPLRLFHILQSSSLLSHVELHIRRIALFIVETAWCMPSFRRSRSISSVRFSSVLAFNYGFITIARQPQFIHKHYYSNNGCRRSLQFRCGSWLCLPSLFSCGVSSGARHGEIPLEQEMPHVNNPGSGKSRQFRTIVFYDDATTSSAPVPAKDIHIWPNDQQHLAPFEQCNGIPAQGGRAHYRAPQQLSGREEKRNSLTGK